MNPRLGVKTSEFWTQAVLQVILLLNTVGIWNYMPPKYTVLIQGVLGAAYALARGLAKVNAAGPVVAASIAPIEPPGDTTETPAAP